jgi:hypothetical protein
VATRTILLVIVFLSIRIVCFPQVGFDSLLVKIDPEKWAASIERKADKLQSKIIATSEKTLSRLQRQEEKIYRKMLSGKDSLMAKAALGNIQDKYESFRQKIKSNVPGGGGQYLPKLDTLNTALKFLDENGITGKVKGALKETEALQNKFQQAEEIKKFIRERRQQLKEQLERLGMVKQLKKINKEVYYYSEQIKQYKEILHDSRKAEKKAIELLGKTKLFRDFMRKNSMLASLFRLPTDGNDPLTQANVAGLQTRAQVNNIIQQQIASGGANGMAQFRQNLQSAQSQIDQLKNKLTQSGMSGSDDIMPEGFKPNSQKTRSFLGRIELGTNVQSQRATNFFPVTSDLGLSFGYKLNDRSIIGLGASYKLGWGHGWNHIKITSEGAGLRSFIDWKLKGSFWISGGYEQNYKTAFSNIVQLKDLNEWQQSGLIGVSKVVNVKSRLFKKTKLQFLWDFLSYRQIPKTQIFLFRIGYGIK